MNEKLVNIPTLPPPEASKEDCREKLAILRRKLFELQNVLYADSRFALLIILQGMDASGKDGTIRHVMTCMNPMGIRVKSFKQPSEEESRHDFLWRIYPHFPEKGMIQVFNRSYYEDIIVPVVHHSLPKSITDQRCGLINEVERHLAMNNTHVLKFYLHISAGKQKERIEARQAKPHKRWKYQKEDEKKAKKWNDYIAAYQMIADKCNQPPWHIIPSDKRWYRNYAVAQILTDYLENLKLKYPQT